MIWPTHQCNRIVKSWSGQGTCETVYQTEDGRVWTKKVIDFSQSTTSGPSTGYLHGDHICEGS
jgi:hypothetical protein